MTTLLHVDSSINGDDSWSRKATKVFADAWRENHPGGTYLYRDLAAEPLPHLDGHAYGALNTDPAEHTAEQADRWRTAAPVIAEVEAADVILLGTPMYNFSIPSNLKSWLDRIAIRRFTAGADGRGPLSDKTFVVATSRGGSYAPGTPRESFEHQEPYLRSLFSYLGVTTNLHFANTEMTLSHVVPALEPFKHVFEETHDSANARLRELAAV